jgi:hypothetical protein
MATNNLKNMLSLLELARRKDPKDNNIAIVETLDRTYSIMQDAVWKEANGRLYHAYNRRASLPSKQARAFNEGVETTASQTVLATSGISMYDDYFEIDKAMLDMESNPAETRNNEALAHVEAIGAGFEDDLFYGDMSADPRLFDGVATLLNDLSHPLVSGCSGTGSDLTSVYMVQWGLDKVFCTYPKNHPYFGVEHRDLGEQTKTLSDGKQYQIYRDHFSMKGGLCIADDRCVARICNIEAADTSGSNIISYKLLIALRNKMLPNTPIVIYCNTDVKTQFDIMAYDKSNGFYTASDIFGRPVTMFQDMPIKLSSKIKSTESQVS